LKLRAIDVRALAVIALSVAAVSCRQASEPAVAESVVGRTFVVSRVAGNLLPTTVSLHGRASCGDAVLWRSEFAFMRDSTFEHRIWTTNPPTGFGAVFRSSYTQDANGGIHIWREASSGRLRKDTLTLRVPFGLLCAIYDWTAVAE
jgi:hypothetical protein